MLSFSASQCYHPSTQLSLPSHHRSPSTHLQVLSIRIPRTSIRPGSHRLVEHVCQRLFGLGHGGQTGPALSGRGGPSVRLDIDEPVLQVRDLAVPGHEVLLGVSLGAGELSDLIGGEVLTLEGGL